MRKLTVAVIVVVWSLGALAQKSSVSGSKKTAHGTTQKLTVKTTPHDKHLPRSSAAPPATASTAGQTNLGRQLSKTETQTANLLTNSGGKSAKTSTRPLPLASAQKPDRNVPIDFQYHPSKGAAPVRGSAQSGKVH